MFVVGVTGGIGSGKTTVTEFFQKLGVPVVDADVIAKQLLAPGELAHNKTLQHFGDGILADDGTIHRAALRTIIFNDHVEKKWMEGLLHPLIQKKAQQELEIPNANYKIYSAALLIENKIYLSVNRVLVVDLPIEEQIKRAAKRDRCSPEKVKKILANQIQREQRLHFADDIIDNSGDEKQTYDQVQALHYQYCEFAAQ